MDLGQVWSTATRSTTIFTPADDSQKGSRTNQEINSIEKAWKLLLLAILDILYRIQAKVSLHAGTQFALGNPSEFQEHASLE